MFTKDNTLKSSNVIEISAFIDRHYVTLQEIAESLNKLTVLEINVPMVLDLLEMRGLVLDSPEGYQLTFDSKHFTRRQYNNGQLGIKWKKDLIPLLSDDVRRFFGKTDA